MFALRLEQANFCARGKTRDWEKTSESDPSLRASWLCQRKIALCCDFVLCKIKITIFISHGALCVESHQEENFNFVSSNLSYFPRGLCFCVLFSTFFYEITKAFVYFSKILCLGFMAVYQPPLDFSICYKKIRNSSIICWNDSNFLVNYFKFWLKVNCRSFGPHYLRVHLN